MTGQDKPSTVPWDVEGSALDSILDAIGRTPMVRLNRVAGEVRPEILVKVEYFSPTGSLKDRIYKRMLQRAVQRGDLKPGMAILESSTGNAGIACAFMGALLSYPVTIVMPEGMSEERKKLIRAYGAEIVETPGGESDVDLCLEKVQEMKAAEPGRYWEPAQFSNRDNVEAHYETTGPEIWEQCGGRVGAFVATQGTGGLVTGTGRFLQERDPAVKLFAAEPSEAPMLARREWGSHRIEGIGDGFVPRNLDISQLDGIVLVSSDEAIRMAQRLAREEGIFCGISAGANVIAALKVASAYPDLASVVTVIPDTGQRYFSTELCGAGKEVEVPDRTHDIDAYTLEQLDRWQAGWVILE
jgi:cysteine synthase